LKADPRDVGGESGEGWRGVDCGRRAERWDQLLMWPAESSKNSLVGSQKVVFYDCATSNHRLISFFGGKTKNYMEISASLYLGCILLA
jgi:hypothetical protein